GTTVTVKNDIWITRWGAFFRRWKLDELPQLWNVLKGDMSFVGPRPDVPGYLDQLSGEGKILLELRPGITGPASLKYRDEETILAQVDDPKAYNDEVIWPDKVAINIDYYRNWSLKADLIYILKTLR
ncbi:MAG: sugar transferase, partial [Marinosulfonomonas sp.]|nr:sugar transferase [Marinosulfonomonas sp.]